MPCPILLNITRGKRCGCPARRREEKPARLRHLVAFAAFATLSAATPAFAITAGDVLDRMTDKEQNGYITGTVDTIIYLEQVSTRGPTSRSNCVLEWYYGRNAKGPKQVVELFGNYRDRSAVGLIKILVDRACPVE